jgi:hypothetical protein
MRGGRIAKDRAICYKEVRLRTDINKLPKCIVDTRLVKVATTRRSGA